MKPPLVVHIKARVADPAPRVAQRLPSEKSDYCPPKGKANPLHTASVWLGRRLVERPSGYFLDRVPVSLDQVMRETNRVLAANGIEQVLHCDRWKV